MQDSTEYARQLARFKLAVRRQLSQSVDLERLVQDPIYAQARLAEIEEIADDEDLLVMVLTLRHKLLPATPLSLPSQCWQAHRQKNPWSAVTTSLVLANGDGAPHLRRDLACRKPSTASSWAMPGSLRSASPYGESRSLHRFNHKQDPTVEK